MHYYKRNLGDYAKKAGRLSMLQHGSYTLLIDACYDREQFPTRDEAIEWTWASSASEVEAVDFVLRKFFTLEDGVYVQKRIQEEIAEYRAKAATNQRIAIERETKRKNPSTKRARTVNEAPPNHKPLTINQEPDGEKPVAVAPHLAGLPPELLKDFLVVRKAKKAGALTPTALKGIDREAKRAGLTLVEAITVCCEAGWQGFNAQWYADRNAPKAGSKFPDKNATPPVSSIWHESAAGIDAKAQELGLEPIGPLESRPAFKARVMAAAREGVPA